MIKIKTIGFVIKHRQPEAILFASQVAEFLISKGINLLVADESPLLAKTLRSVPKPDLVDICDLIVVFGGDGTFLSVARLMKNRSVPVMGINMGQLGFLTEFRKDEAIPALEKLISGTPPLISERALLEVTLKRENKVIFQGPVVNDAVISKGAIARIIGM